MNKWVGGFVLGLMLVGLAGCASTGSSESTHVATTSQFTIESINFKFEQKIKPDVQYHTPEELEKMFKERIVADMKEKKLLSDKEGVNKLKIDATYKRQFVGEATPFPSDALAYPIYGYKIDVMDGEKSIATVEKDGLTYSGGMAMNFKVMAASLRDKKYEIDFVNALADGIVDRIGNL